MFDVFFSAMVIFHAENTVDSLKALFIIDVIYFRQVELYGLSASTTKEKF